MPHPIAVSTSGNMEALKININIHIRKDARNE